MKVSEQNKFTIFRILFGLFSCYYFISLLPYGTEIFSREGSLKDLYLNRSPNFLLDLIAFVDSPVWIRIFLILGTLISVMLSIGVKRRICGILLYLLHNILLYRNNLSIDISSFYLNYMFLLCAILPQKDSLAVSIFPLKLIKQRGEELPRVIYWLIWMTTSIGFLASGISKATNPAWLDGTAINLILQGPLGQNHWLASYIADSPKIGRILTYSTLVVEIGLILGSFHRRLRNIMLLLVTGMFLGISLNIQLREIPFVIIIFLFLSFEFSKEPVD